MDRHIAHKNISIVFIPDYISKALDTRGITLDVLDKYISNDDSNNIKIINKILTDNIAIYDLHDLIDYNRMLYAKLLPDVLKKYDTRPISINYITNHLAMLTDHYFIEDLHSRLIELYYDPKIDVESIIVSRNNMSIESVCNIAHTDNTVFIILRNGFTNFIMQNIKGFKEVFLANVVDFIHKVYGEDVLNNSTIFNTYIRACNNATVEHTV